MKLKLSKRARECRNLFFMVYNLLGGLLWSVCFCMLGYYFGKVIPNADEFIMPILAGIIGFCLLFSLIMMLVKKDSRHKLYKMLEKLFGRI